MPVCFERCQAFQRSAAWPCWMQARRVGMDHGSCVASSRPMPNLMTRSSQQRQSLATARLCSQVAPPYQRGCRRAGGTIGTSLACRVRGRLAGHARTAAAAVATPRRNTAALPLAAPTPRASGRRPAPPSRWKPSAALGSAGNLRCAALWRKGGRRHRRHPGHPGAAVLCRPAVCMPAGRTCHRQPAWRPSPAAA